MRKILIGLLCFIGVSLPCFAGSAYTCTAWFVNDQGYLVTAGHCAKKAMMVQYKDKWVPARTVAIDKDHDIAILSTGLKNTPSLPINQSFNGKGYCDVWGFPEPDRFGWKLTHFYGEVWANDKTLEWDARTCPGDSGGPVISEGRVVAVVSGGYCVTQDKIGCMYDNFGPKIVYVAFLLEKLGVGYYLDEKVDLSNMVDRVLLLEGVE